MITNTGRTNITIIAVPLFLPGAADSIGNRFRLTKILIR
jgi:hypothetical protein